MTSANRPTWTFARSRSRSGLLALLAVLVAATTVLVSLVIVGSGVAAANAARSTMTAHLGGNPTWLVQTRLSDDPATQDEQMRSLTREIVSGFSLEIGRQLVAEPANAELPSGRSRVQLAWVEETGIQVDGLYPGDGEILLPADGSVPGAIGEKITVRSAEFTVSGLWSPLEEPGAGSVFDSGGSPRVIVGNPARLTDFEPFVLWDIRLDPEDINLDGLASLGSVAGQLKRSLDVPGVAVRGLSVQDFLETDSGQMAVELQRSTAAARAVGLVPAGLLIAIAVITLIQLTGMITESRRRETELLLARGATAGKLVRLAARETTVAAILGGIVGASTVVGGLFLMGGLRQWSAAVTIGVIVAVCTVIAAMWSTRRLARSLEAGANQSRRGARAASVGLLLLVLVIAVLSSARVAELRSVVSTSDSGPVVDWLAVLALPSAILLGAVVTLVALGPLSALIAGAASKTRGLASSLGARQVSRNIRAAVVPALLFTLAGASLVVATTFDGTTHALRTRSAEFASGAPIRVVLPPRAGQAAKLSPDVSAISSLDGVSSVVPVRHAPITLERESGELIAIAADEIANVVPEFVATTSADLAELRGMSGLVRIPEGSASVQLNASAKVSQISGRENTSVHITVTPNAFVRVVDAAGVTHEWSFDGPAASVGPEFVSFDLSGELPSAVTGEAQLVSAKITLTPSPIDIDPEIPFLDIPEGLTHEEVEAIVEQYFEDYPLNPSSFAETEVRFDSIGVDGKDASGAYTTAIPTKYSEDSAHAQIGPAGEYLFSFSVTSWASKMEVTVTGELPPTIPAIVTEDAAAHFGADIGDSFGVAFEGPTLELTVLGIVPAIPGTTARESVLVDISALSKLRGLTSAGVSGPNELWITPKPGADDLMERVREISAEEYPGPGGELPVVSGPEPKTVDRAATVRLTFWIAGIAAALLAFVAATSAVVSNVRERRSDLAVLRALGWEAKKAARMRRIEFLALSLPAIVGGIALGWIVSNLYVDRLARTVTGELAPHSLAFAWTRGGLAVGVLLLATIILALVLGRQARRQMRRRGGVEDLQ